MYGGCVLSPHGLLLRAIVTIKRICGLPVDWHQFFKTNRNSNTIMCAATSFTCLLKISLAAGLWAFVLKEYLYCLCCVKAVSVLVSSNYLHAYAAAYQKFPTLVLVSFLRFFYFFLSKQDRCGAKVAFVSSRFENPLSRTLYFSTV